MEQTPELKSISQGLAAALGPIGRGIVPCCPNDIATLRPGLDLGGLFWHERGSPSAQDGLQLGIRQSFSVYAGS